MPGRHAAAAPYGASGVAALTIPGVGVQGTIDELGRPLHDVTFVVVDLETTGGSPLECAITEIGAVKVRGGEVLGEFATLVNPRQPIPAFIASLTGITDAMVAVAPRIDTVLPAFLEWARGCVLVAHNAGFDVSFLKADAARLGMAWPAHEVVDTVRLARHVVTREEVRNHRLSTLAAFFRSSTVPNHRALQDARATVDVLHGMLARLGNLGVTSMEELATYTSRVPAAQRRKRYLAEAMPHAPGVYVFNGPRGEVLYVGTSVDLRTRVRTYFTASETRSRMSEMVQIAVSVTPIVCATPLEAQVRELRLIAEHKPRYNRRSRHAERAPWVKLTVEPFPRLSIVRAVGADAGDGAVYLGPFHSTRSAEQAVAALHEAFPLRQCSGRLPARPSPSARDCVLAQIGRCGAPCTGGQDAGSYGRIVERVRAAVTGAATPVAEAVLHKVSVLSEQQRYEDAATQRDRLVAFVRGALRTQRLAPLSATPELIAALRAEEGGWEIVLVRHGRLAGTTCSPRGADPWPYIEALKVGGEVVAPGRWPAPAGLPEETEKILRWLDQPGVRMVHVDGEWTCPVGGAGSLLERVDPVGSSRSRVPGFDHPLVHPGRQAALG